MNNNNDNEKDNSIFSITMNVKKSNKIDSCIDFEKQEADFGSIQKHANKYIMPILEKQCSIKKPRFTRMQLISLGGETQFYHTDSYYHCNTIQSYSCMYFLNDTTVHIIPQSHTFKIERKVQALKAYKTKKTYHCARGTILCFPSNSHYCFAETTGHVLQFYDIVPKKDLASFIHKLKTVEVNKNTLIQHFCKRIGLCYKKKLHFIYYWIHFFQYCSVKNDFQYKSCLTDLPPESKAGHVISYENRPRNKLQSGKKMPFDHFIIVESDIDHAIPDNFYLYKFIRIMIILMVITIVLFFWKDNEIRTFFGDKLKRPGPGLGPGPGPGPGPIPAPAPI
jgi:hypothetical protein